MTTTVAVVALSCFARLTLSGRIRELAEATGSGGQLRKLDHS